MRGRDVESKKEAVASQKKPIVTKKVNRNKIKPQKFSTSVPLLGVDQNKVINLTDENLLFPNSPDIL